MMDSNPSNRYQRNFAPYGTHELILSMVPAGAKVLDVGCATGYLGAVLRDRGCSVWGIDSDAEALTSAATHYADVALVDLDVSTVLPWKRDFDVIIAADVLEHLREPAQTLQALSQHGRENARVIVSLPNVAHVSIRLSLLVGRFDYRDSGILDRTHCRLFTFASARELAESAGLKIERLVGGSDRFGRVLQSSSGQLLRGLLAYNIVVVATRTDSSHRRSET